MNDYPCFSGSLCAVGDEGERPVRVFVLQVVEEDPADATGDAAVLDEEVVVAPLLEPGEERDDGRVSGTKWRKCVYGMVRTGLRMDYIRLYTQSRNSRICWQL